MHGSGELPLLSPLDLLCTTACVMMGMDGVCNHLVHSIVGYSDGVYRGKTLGGVEDGIFHARCEWEYGGEGVEVGKWSMLCRAGAIFRLSIAFRYTVYTCTTVRGSIGWRMILDLGEY